ncbi:hypothetical protein TEA_006686 [Camellia sinensis var. sinensis]|uniref:NAC domain-containing protein n=1 Tax=Camellia sinensis var. sinensis TaxID=542762 RepID=A0A4S4DVH9_CAMSN|nr:hypothetical protein TEA_006686 [Camellia sinensis var. sinensis]
MIFSNSMKIKKLEKPTKVTGWQNQPWVSKDFVVFKRVVFLQFNFIASFSQGSSFWNFIRTKLSHDMARMEPEGSIWKALFGKEECYFFTPRDRKYPNGVRPNRMAASGYWKATGTNKQIRSSCGARIIGVKKALVFYRGRPPRGIKTDWNMQEYKLPEATMLTSNQKGCIRWWWWGGGGGHSGDGGGEGDGSGDSAVPLVRFPPFYSSINGHKRKQPTEGTQYENFIQPKKVTDRDDQWSDNRTESNLCITNQSEGNNFNTNQWNSIIQYQEFNHLDFAEGDLGRDLELELELELEMEMEIERENRSPFPDCKGEDFNQALEVECDVSQSINCGIIVIRGDLQVGGIVRFGSAFHEEIKEGK